MTFLVGLILDILWRLLGCGRCDWKDVGRWKYRTLSAFYDTVYLVWAVLQIFWADFNHQAASAEAYLKCLLFLAPLSS